MIFTLAFSAFAIAILWPYFMAVDILDYKKNPNAPEHHLPGRPARRTIGRINQDIFVSVIAIIVFYLSLGGIFFGLPAISRYLNEGAFLLCLVAATGAAFYYVVIYNRIVFAYAALPQIVVIHVCGIVASATGWDAFVNGHIISWDTALQLTGLMVGIMLVSSRNIGERRKKEKEEETEML